MSDARSVYKQGFRCFTEGDTETAVAKYREALAIDPGLAIAWNALSIALRKQKDLDGAIAAARKLVELEPEDPLSHTNLSILFQMNGMIAEAEDEKAEAMKLEMRAKRGS